MPLSCSPHCVINRPSHLKEGSPGSCKLYARGITVFGSWSGSRSISCSSWAPAFGLGPPRPPRICFSAKQLALYRERQVKPGRASDSLRLTLVLLARRFAWREALTIVQPATLLRWHRNAFRVFWRWRSRPGRPRLPAELQPLVAAMARDNVTWGDERIAAELLVKLGIRISLRPVRRGI
jgi:hypothetical protein